MEYWIVVDCSPGWIMYFLTIQDYTSLKILLDLMKWEAQVDGEVYEESNVTTFTVDYDGFGLGHSAVEQSDYYVNGDQLPALKTIFKSICIDQITLM